MDCHEIRALTSLSLDRELDSQSEALVTAHLDTCADCREYRQRQETIRVSLCAAATYHHAPSNLFDRISNALPTEHKRGIGNAEHKVRNSWILGWRILNGAGLAAAVCAMLIMVIVIRLQPSADDLLRDEVVASHARALLTQHVMDVASSDQHTVKPWFNGRLGFSPPVRDFAEQGFPLVGGRLDYVDHHAVAVVVYRRRQHLIDVFIWPSTAKAPPTQSALGYHLAAKTVGGMIYLAISDVDPNELVQFVEML